MAVNRKLKLEFDEDARLMQRVVEGDSTAFDLLHEKCRKTLKDYVASICVNHVSPDDVAQEVFFRLWHKRTTFRNQAAFKTYLYGIAKNVVHENHRQIQREAITRQNLWQVAKQFDQQAESQTAFNQQEIATLIEQAKSCLSDKQQQALELVFYSGMSPAQAAEEAGCSKTAFRRRFHDAKRRLTGVLEDFRVFG